MPLILSPLLLIRQVAQFFCYWFYETKNIAVLWRRLELGKKGKEGNFHNLWQNIIQIPKFLLQNSPENNPKRHDFSTLMFSSLRKVKQFCRSTVDFFGNVTINDNLPLGDVILRAFNNHILNYYNKCRIEVRDSLV